MTSCAAVCVKVYLITNLIKEATTKPHLLKYFNIARSFSQKKVEKGEVFKNMLIISIL